MTGGCVGLYYHNRLDTIDSYNKYTLNLFKKLTKMSNQIKQVGTVKAYCVSFNTSSRKNVSIVRHRWISKLVISDNS